MSVAKRRDHSAGVRARRPILLRLAILLVAFVAAIAFAYWTMIRMPGKSFRGQPAPLSAEQLKLEVELRADVEKLASEIGQRNLRTYSQLTAAADFIERSFSAAGLGSRREGYEVGGRTCDNIEGEVRGSGKKIVVLGAHYDSVLGSPGANDNGSGVAALLALARRFAEKPSATTLRFVAFVNEEAPFFQSNEMGSTVYARRCKARGDDIVGMFSLETIGCFFDSPGTQHYPLPILAAVYPSVGNFIAFVGNTSSRGLLHQAIGSFRKHAQIPSEGAALPTVVPGIGWSDQWSFWQQGYPALMITDTAPFRYPHYHSEHDTPDQLNYPEMTRVVWGVEKMIDELISKITGKSPDE